MTIALTTIIGNVLSKNKMNGVMTMTTTLSDNREIEDSMAMDKRIDLVCISGGANK